MPKMTDEELVEALATEAQRSIGGHDGSLAEDIATANNYYEGKPYGNEKQGRSQFVTREVMETIEGMLPYLIKVFFSADQATVFEPEDEDDIALARQETEYVNWVFYKWNPGFKIGYTWIKDALLNKNGIVKCTREESHKKLRETYKNLTEEQVTLLLGEKQGEEAEVAEFLRDEESGLFDITLTIRTDDSKTVVTPIPPEEFRITDGAADIQSARYVAHTPRLSISELREQGYKVDEDISDDISDIATGVVHQDRHQSVSQGTNTVDDGAESGPNRKVQVMDEYMKVDVDGDGVAERWHVVRVGHTILFKEPVNEVPLYGWTPSIITHRFYGQSVSDLVMDIQLLKSKFLRNLLDNQEKVNNGRYAVVDGQVNLDDLLSSAPHGVVRTSFPDAVKALDTPQLSNTAFDVLTYTDSILEKRAGVSERSTGLDPRQFNSNTAATTAERVMAAAEQKIELIARIFAETGLKDLMLAIHRLGLKYEVPGRKIRTNNGEFVAIDPRAWKERNEMTVTVGIGNGSKTMQLVQLAQLQQSQQMIAAGGGLGTILTPTNVYNLAIAQTEAMGRKDGTKFFSKPESDEIDNGPSIEEQAKMAEIQLEQKKQENEEAKVVLEQAKLDFQREELALKEKIHEDENQFKLAELKLEATQQRAAKIGN